MNYLKTALEAVREKSLLKQHKDKLTTAEKSGGTTNNNLIVDRNEILRMLGKRDEKSVNTFDAEEYNADED